MNYQRKKRKKPNIDLVPMIDVIFFLVIFFMLFTTLKTSQAGIEVDLPTAEAAANQKPSSVEVTINKNGLTYYEGVLVDKSSLTSRLSETIRRDPEKIVIIRADREVKYEHVVEVMDIVGKVGGKKFAFAVEKVSR